ncbi:TPA: hypothetical protein NKS49_004528 [Vibrio parahaemolyticus]|nr:hypothetical protein [Vibrio parahaemolyticus]
MSLMSKDLFKSIVKSSNSHDLVDKVGETALDAVLDDGVLKDIPIIGTAVSLYKAGDSIRANLFAKKILAFLNEIEDLSLQQRQHFIEQNFTNVEDEEKVSEVILSFIDNADRAQSCTYLGRAFKLYALGYINQRTYDLYCSTLRRLSNYLIQQIHQFYRNEQACGVELHAIHELASLGLLDIAVTLQMFDESKGLLQQPKHNDFGRHFYINILAQDFA